MEEVPRPKGPAFNSHVREDVDPIALNDERRRCGRMWGKGGVGPSGLKKILGILPRPDERGY